MSAIITSPKAPLSPGKAESTAYDETMTQFGKCKMCSCSRYTTSSNDWQFCDCGHSRSQHQH